MFSTETTAWNNNSFLPLQDGQTPLLIATRKGSRMIVAALLEADANPNFMLQVWFILFN